MLFVDKILYRRISEADFKNIENVKKPRGGNGQTYVDLSGIDANAVVEFCSYGTKSPGSKKVEDGIWPSFTLDVYPIGSGTPYPIDLELRRPNNYRLCRQRQDRHPAWRSDAGFPTLFGPNSSFSPGDNYPDSQLDPVVKPLVENLTIYIVRTTNHHYIAGFINSPSIPSSWPVDADLEKLLSKNWDSQARSGTRGIYTPPYLLEFINEA